MREPRHLTYSINIRQWDILALSLSFPALLCLATVCAPATVCHVEFETEQCITSLWLLLIPSLWTKAKWTRVSGAKEWLIWIIFTCQGTTRPVTSCIVRHFHQTSSRCSARGEWVSPGDHIETNMSPWCKHPLIHTVKSQFGCLQFLWVTHIKMHLDNAGQIQFPHKAARWPFLWSKRRYVTSYFSTNSNSFF